MITTLNVLKNWFINVIYYKIKEHKKVLLKKFAWYKIFELLKIVSINLGTLKTEANLKIICKTDY